MYYKFCFVNKFLQIISSFKLGFNDTENYFETYNYTQIKQNHCLKAYIKFDVKSNQPAALYLQLFLLFVHDSFGGLEGGQYKTQDKEEWQVHL